jgi:hypothetical protein
MSDLQLETMKPRQARRPLRRILHGAIGSLFSVAIGCLAGAATMTTTNVVMNSQWPTHGLVRGIATEFEIIGLFALPVWLVLLLPLYIMVPRSSRLWQPWLCSLVGAFCGGTIFILYLMTMPAPLESVWLFLPAAVVTGAVTCLLGATTRRFGEASIS